MDRGTSGAIALALGLGTACSNGVDASSTSEALGTAGGAGVETLTYVATYPRSILHEGLWMDIGVGGELSLSLETEEIHTHCRVTAATLACPSLPRARLRVTNATATTATIAVDFDNLPSEYTSYWLRDALAIHEWSEESDDDGSDDPPPECTHEEWCVGTTFYIRWESCSVYSSEDDYRCGGGNEPPLEVTAVE